MILEVNYDNIIDATYIHAESWKESHRSFCSVEFVEAHTIERQREGCGSELLGYAISKCTGIPSLWVLNNNAKAQNFYEKHGFIRTGREKRLSGNLAEEEMTRVCMQCYY